MVAPPLSDKPKERQLVTMSSYMRKLVLFVAICDALSAQNLYFQNLPSETIEARFNRLRRTNAERATELASIFADAGCKQPLYSEQVVKGSKLPNLICHLAGSSERTIVVGAHYDKVNAGDGAIDNWSGASLLPSLFESLRTVGRQVTFEFVAFTDEEKGLVGSEFYVKTLPKDARSNVVANVNIDSLGIKGPPRIWTGLSSKKLVDSAALIANSLQIKVQGFDLQNLGISDSASFRVVKIPTIDFHSLDDGRFDLLHSKKDVATSVDIPSYYATYRLLTAYLAYLDVQNASSAASEPSH